MGKRPNFLSRLLANPTRFTFILAIATGLYPVIFYYSRNYPLINSWRHLLFFMALFMGVPVVVFGLLRLFFKLKWPDKNRMRVYTFLNVLFFLVFIQLCLYTRPQLWFTFGAVIVSFLVSGFLYSQLKKIVVFQWLLALVAVFWLVPVVQSQLNYSEAWLQQPDEIEKVIFKTKPNIYFIQPDGYVNFSEIDKGYYQIDNSEFKSFLQGQDFTIYPNFRSNYCTTLTSNASVFSMKHHYYNNGFNFSERMNLREVIVSDNAVLRVLKNNGYKTHLLAEWAYLLANLPEMGYDECNFSYDELPYLTTGLDEIREVAPYLEQAMQRDTLQPKFYFIELFLPGHIATTAAESAGVEGEKEWWTNNLRESNKKLETLLSMIEDKDPNALVVLLSDHGGYVGMEYMSELRSKSNDRDKIYSAFSSLLAVKWPKEYASNDELPFRSGVNFFRILFSQLAVEPDYLDQLQDDGSYHNVDRGAPKGVYQYINGDGKIVFKLKN